MQYNLKNIFPNDFTLLMIAQENNGSKEEQYKEVIEHVEAWKRGFEKEVRELIKGYELALKMHPKMSELGIGIGVLKTILGEIG